MPKIGRLDARKRQKSIPPAYNAPKNRPTGVRTPNSKSLTEAPGGNTSTKKLIAVSYRRVKRVSKLICTLQNNSCYQGNKLIATCS